MEGQIANITHDFANGAVAADGKVFIGSSSEDCVRAFELETGKLLWTFYCDAAVRLTPTWAGGNLLFGSDDGYAYCLDANAGEEVWRYTPAPRRRWAINNGRLMAQWPIRTGVTVEDGIAYFAAGLFPPHGVYLCALKVADGAVVWKNELNVNQSTAFQGHIMIDGDTLYFPTGRTSPVAVNKTDGSLVRQVNFDYRRSGGGVDVTFLAKDVMAYGPNQSGVLNIRVRLDPYPDTPSWAGRTNGGPCGRVTTLFAQTIATDDESVYILRTYRASHNRKDFTQTVLAVDKARFLEALNEAMDEKRPNFPNFGGKWFVGSEDERTGSKLPGLSRWQQEASDQSLSMIVAGTSLIVGGKDFVELRSGKTGEIVWTSPVQGEVWSLAVADSALVACTDKGITYCFRSGAKVEPKLGAGLPTPPKRRTEGLPERRRPSVGPVARSETGHNKVGPVARSETGHNRLPAEHKPQLTVPYKEDADYRHAAEFTLAQTDRRRGFCLVLDAGEGQLAYEIARRSEFYVVGLETDVEKVAVARRKLSQAGLYGARVVVHYCPEPSIAAWPSYMANLIVSGADIKGAVPSYHAKEVFRVLRPYGGVLVLGSAEDLPAWAGEHIAGFDPTKPVTRGELPGAGNWSHMYADTANTSNSDDALVKGLEYDLQWMGPPGTERIINRHMTPMGPLYMNGRMYVFGYNYVTVVDAYNGTFLWEKEIPNSSRVIMALNAAPICVDERHFYCVSANECWVMDVRNGQLVRKLKGLREEADWGFIASTGTHLVGTTQNPKARMTKGDRGWNWRILHGDAAGKPNPSKPVVGDVLFVLDAGKHEQLWRREKGIVLHSSITIAAGVIYFAENRNNELRANGVGYVPLDQFVASDAWFVAVQLTTGKLLWERPISMPAANCLYLVKAKPDALLAVTAFPKIEPPEKDGERPVVRTCYEFRAISTADGTPLWDKSYQGDGKGILTNETNHNQFLMHPNIVGNTLVMAFYPGGTWVLDMATREATKVKAAYRCSPAAASRTNLFYRAGYCSTFDLSVGKGAPLTRITRPSCWISMLPAGGLIMMPEYGSTSCRCGYPIQTSVVMVPRQRP